MKKLDLTDAERKEKKRLYDLEYRAKNLAAIKAKKAAAYALNPNREKEREYRKKNMNKHVEYCRSPEYKAYKAEYDRKKRFEEYGPFAEAAMVLESLEKEISTQASRYEIYIANGRFTRSAQRRRRELWLLKKQNLLHQL
jgi:hypothetical protein